MSAYEKELLTALLDMRNACAGAMRVLARHGLEDEFIAECRGTVPAGFGARADDAIAKGTRVSAIGKLS